MYTRNSTSRNSAQVDGYFRAINESTNSNNTTRPLDSDPVAAACEESKYGKRFKKHSNVLNTTLKVVMSDLNIETVPLTRNGDSAVKRCRLSELPPNLESVHTKILAETSNILDEPNVKEVANGGIIVVPFASFYDGTASYPKLGNPIKDVDLRKKTLRARISMSTDEKPQTSNATRDSKVKSSTVFKLNDKTADEKSVKVVLDTEKTLKKDGKALGKELIPSGEETGTTTEPDTVNSGFFSPLPPSPVLNLDSKATECENTQFQKIALKSRLSNNSDSDLLSQTNDAGSDANSDIVIKNVRSVYESYAISSDNATETVSTDFEARFDPFVKMQPLTTTDKNNAAKCSLERATGSSDMRASSTYDNCREKRVRGSPKHSRVHAAKTRHKKHHLQLKSDKTSKFDILHGNRKIEKRKNGQPWHKGLKLRIKLNQKVAATHIPRMRKNKTVLSWEDHTKIDVQEGESEAEIDIVNVWSKSTDDRMITSTLKDEGVIPQENHCAKPAAISDRSASLEKIDFQLQHPADEGNAVQLTKPNEPASADLVSLSTEPRSPRRNITDLTFRETLTPKRIPKLSSSPMKACVVLSDILPKLTPTQARQLEPAPDDTVENPHYSSVQSLHQKTSRRKELAVLRSEKKIALSKTLRSREARWRSREAQLSALQKNMRYKRLNAMLRPRSVHHRCSNSDCTNVSHPAGQNCCAVLEPSSADTTSANASSSKPHTRLKQIFGEASTIVNFDKPKKKYRNIGLKRFDSYYEIAITVESLKKKDANNVLRREYNFLDTAALRELISAFRVCQKSGNCKAVLLSSVGPIFSSGLNPRSLLDWNFALEVSQDVMSLTEQFINLLINFEKPIIAALQGPAVGLGASLLLFCDGIYASERASIQWLEVRMGLSAYGCVTYLLPQLVGQCRARSLLLEGRILTAKEAKDLGIITEIFPHDSYLRHAVAACRQLCVSPSMSLRNIKKLLMARNRKDLGKCASKELAMLKHCLKSTECQDLLQGYILKELILI